MDGNRVCYRVSPEAITELIEKEEIYPGLLTAAILLSFERGITWMGGMFQASYLPAWQRCFVRLLKEMKLEKEAELIGAMTFLDILVARCMHFTEERISQPAQGLLKC